MINSDKNILLSVLAQTLKMLSGERLVAAVLKSGACDEPCWQVVSIGKAAAAMACGAVDGLGWDRISKLLVITKSGHGEPWQSRLDQAVLVDSAHPIPDQRSLDAGQCLLDAIQQNTGEPLLFLISGGTSSLVESLPPTLTLADLQRINQWLQASGLPISAINTVRSHMSTIKAGGLLQALKGRRGQALLLSDVEGDDPAIIGSGLLYASPQPQALPEGLPAWLSDKLSVVRRPSASCAVAHQVIANLDTAKQRFAENARAAGFTVTVIDEALSGAAEFAAKHIVEFLRRAAPGLYIYGGETTVTLPAVPGRGGRNQHLALAAAIALSGVPDIQLMAIGTDGDDGNSEDAGALIDGGTISRGLDAGLDAMDCLRRADAGSFLEASGDLVATGPTGTNLRDLVVALKR